jgi:hypothetical protein
MWLVLVHNLVFEVLGAEVAWWLGWRSRQGKNHGERKAHTKALWCCEQSQGKRCILLDSRVETLYQVCLVNRGLGTLLDSMLASSSSRMWCLPLIRTICVHPEGGKEKEENLLSLPQALFMGQPSLCSSVWRPVLDQVSIKQDDT